MTCAPSTSFASLYECEGYRLPTEAEWELAARSGTASAFWTGDGAALGGDYSVNDCTTPVTIEDGVSNPLLGNDAWFCGNNGEFGDTDYGSKEVGGAFPNGYGLYDMHGNLWEWTNDWYDSVYPSKAIDPIGSVAGSSRVLRGGYWSNNPINISTSFRSHNSSPSERARGYGFRLCRSAP